MIHINCKEGVYFKFIGFEFLTLARIVYRIYEKYEVVPTVTSACDSEHNSDRTKTLHDDGLAWDWRIWGLKNPKVVADEIKKEAQAIDYHYDIVLESDHLHTEYDIHKERPTGFA